MVIFSRLRLYETKKTAVRSSNCLKLLCFDDVKSFFAWAFEYFPSISIINRLSLQGKKKRPFLSALKALELRRKSRKSSSSLTQNIRFFWQQIPLLLNKKINSKQFQRRLT